MCPTRIDLYGIAHVKVDIQEIYVIPWLGRFVWTATFEQCEYPKQFLARLVSKKAL